MCIIWQLVVTLRTKESDARETGKAFLWGQAQKGKALLCSCMKTSKELAFLCKKLATAASSSQVTAVWNYSRTHTPPINTNHLPHPRAVCIDMLSFWVAVVIDAAPSECI